jgi:type IV pilus assembly protein PilP
MSRWLRRAATCLMFALALGCEDTKVTQSPGKPAASAQRPAPGPAAKKAPPPPAEAEPAAPLPPKVNFDEEDFVETERSRDPFRSFTDLFVDRPAEHFRVKRRVILENFAIDDLRLIGVVTGIVPAKAMLVDPAGQGFVIEKGNYIGRAERVQAGVNNTEYEINWKVDKIREADVVLVREDPSNPDVPSATRVVALRPKEKEPEETN